MLSSEKLTLPNKIGKISLKLSALFFKKLVLYDREDLNSQPIRHYDLQCEAIAMLDGFFSTKLQLFKMKAFENLKLCQNEEKVVPATMTDLKHITDRTRMISRKFNSSFQEEPDFSPTSTMNKKGYKIKQKIENILFQEQKKSQHEKKNQHEKNHHSQNSLSSLLNRVKEVNRKYETERVYGINSHCYEANNETFSHGPHSSMLNYYKSCAIPLSNSHFRSTYEPQYMKMKTDVSRNNFEGNYLSTGQNKYNKSERLVRKGDRRRYILDKISHLQGKIQIMENQGVDIQELRRESTMLMRMH